jgi:putative ABC transport system permease protein
VDDGKLGQMLKDISEVKGFENWGNSAGKIKYKDGKIGNIYSIMALTSNTKTLEPVMMEGRWLLEGDTNEIVIGHQFYSNESDYEFGDTITLQIGEKEQQFKIVGTIKELGSPTIYINREGFEKLIPEENKKNSIKLILQSGVEEKDVIYQKVEDKLKENGVIVFQAESMQDLLEVLQSHGLLVIAFFLVIAILILIVAGFGLTSTMSVQVSERTKEIGILKAMGASKKQIKRMVITESIFICIVSWIISIVLGILLGAFIASAMGYVLIGTALNVDYISSYFPVLVWLVLTVLIGYKSSRASAKKAGKMTIKDAFTFSIE